MSINLPDKLFKLLVLIGIIIIGYSQYNIDKELQRNILPTDETIIKMANNPLAGTQILKRSDSLLKQREINIKFYTRILKQGFIIFFMGIIIWLIADYFPGKKKTIRQNEKIYKYCQSCAKNFSSIRNYGTNKDLSQNYAFCKGCYEKGEFTKPYKTKQEFLNEADNLVKGKNWFIRSNLRHRFTNLERWNSNDYS